MIAPRGVRNVQLALVPDEAYFNCLLRLISDARVSIFASVFIIEVSPARDPDLRVDRVFRALQASQWRGADVRILAGGSRDNMQIAELALTATTIGKKYGLDARWLTRLDVKGSHCKMVIADDWSLVGSHNWSPGAFSGQIQDSVLVRDQAMASHLRARFFEQWDRTDHGQVAH